MKNQNNVYIISGPAGVGKSTISHQLVKQFYQSAYISGDDISHMHVNGRQKPWESQEEITLIWSNILSLTKNFLLFNNDVVIDYVTFPSEANWLKENLTDMNVTVHYVVLWANQDILLKRDALRIPEHQMGKRCIELIQEFEDAEVSEENILDTSEYEGHDVPLIVKEILNARKYIMV
ncbi:AAA family ATPase [Gracilibacillus massiliensis]|uniref:AAA family ATPase n=1 Tax=Gracilibacillus massiliensis TaxID=1564956 RepID=UPI00071E5242|nr:AAA family ATPase [Gracilibacillus massiliensis]